MTARWGTLTLMLAILQAASPFRAAALPAYISLEHMISDLSIAGEPAFQGNALVLTYQPSPPRPVRYVAARFEHEGFGRLHVFYRKEAYSDPTMRWDAEARRWTSVSIRSPDRDVFYLVVSDLPESGRIAYRIVVDGLWMLDPLNAARDVDPVTGLPVSVVRAPARGPRPSASPVFMPDGRVQLNYVGTPGSHVAVLGDFNGWDPYMHRLAESSPGRFFAELRVPPGEQRYVFLVDGARREDPLNASWSLDGDGRRVSLMRRSVDR